MRVWCQSAGNDDVSTIQYGDPGSGGRDERGVRLLLQVPVQRLGGRGKVFHMSSRNFSVHVSVPKNSQSLLALWVSSIAHTVSGEPPSKPFCKSRSLLGPVPRESRLVTTVVARARAGSVRVEEKLGS